MNILDLKDEALQAYNRVPQSEAAPFLQAAMLAEIALQLAGINEKLEKITERGGSADVQGSALGDIAKMLYVIADKK